MPPQISIKELHATTGHFVRQAGRSRTPLVITDRGEAVAVLASPAHLAGGRPRRRTLLPEFTALMKRKPAGNLEEDLSAIRDDR
jgi:hypothetical protein